MNVMYLCDNNYIDIVGVSIVSLMKNNKWDEEINIFLVIDNVSKENIQKLKKMIQSYGNNLFVIDMPDIQKMLGIKIETHWWVENVFSRVFLNTVFEKYQDLERLIYIDCDTLIVGSLQELWKMKLEPYCAAGVCEAMSKWHKKAIGLSDKDYYFNAGVFLINLMEWRKENLDAASLNFIRCQNGKLEYADESVLNYVLHNKIKKLNPKYNLTALSIYLTEKETRIFRKESFYTEEERQKALTDAKIIHFTSTFMDKRPWVEGSKHPYVKVWKEYKEMTPWKNTPLKKDKSSLLKRIGKKCISILPKFIRLYLAGFLHAYIKPLKYL